VHEFDVIWFTFTRRPVQILNHTFPICKFRPFGDGGEGLRAAIVRRDDGDGPAVFNGGGLACGFVGRGVGELGLFLEFEHLGKLVSHFADGGYAEAEGLWEGNGVGIVGVDVAVDEAWEEGVSGFRECWDGDFGSAGGWAYSCDLAVGDVDEAGLDGCFAGKDSDVADEEGCHNVLAWMGFWCSWKFVYC
jgi:hypothetical protein